MFAVYHGPQGLRSIAAAIHRMACQLAGALKERDWAVHPGPFFDTIRVWLAGDRADHILERASRQRREPSEAGRPCGEPYAR